MLNVDKTHRATYTHDEEKGPSRGFTKSSPEAGSASV